MDIDLYYFKGVSLPFFKEEGHTPKDIVEAHIVRSITDKACLVFDGTHDQYSDVEMRFPDGSKMSATIPHKYLSARKTVIQYVSRENMVSSPEQTAEWLKGYAYNGVEENVRHIVVKSFGSIGEREEHLTQLLHELGQLNIRRNQIIAEMVKEN